MRKDKNMDRRVTEILVGEGMTGKTAELIKMSAESGIYILVANRKRAEILAEQARNMKLYIPFPVTLQEWLRSENRFHGSSIRRDGLLIDDVDDVIKELFLPIEIKAVTLRTPRNVRNLDKENRNANDKQIEEMARITCYMYRRNKEKKCGGVAECDTKCLQYNRCEELYNAGYRKQEWISVEERLPDNYRCVLVACEGLTIGGYAQMVIGSYGGGFWSLLDADGTAYLTKYMRCVVTHWMPLPEPPKMKGGAE